MQLRKIFIALFIANQSYGLCMQAAPAAAASTIASCSLVQDSEKIIHNKQPLEIIICDRRVSILNRTIKTSWTSHGEEENKIPVGFRLYHTDVTNPDYIILHFFLDIVGQPKIRLKWTAETGLFSWMLTNLPTINPKNA